MLDNVVALQFRKDLLILAEKKPRHDLRGLDRFQNSNNVAKIVEFALGLEFSSEVIRLEALACESLGHDQAQVDRWLVADLLSLANEITQRLSSIENFIEDVVYVRLAELTFLLTFLSLSNLLLFNVNISGPP